MNGKRLIFDTPEVMIDLGIVRRETRLIMGDADKGAYIVESNFVECGYFYSGEGLGWSTVDMMRIGVEDLAALAEGLDGVLDGKVHEFMYTAVTGLFEVAVEKKDGGYGFVFLIADNSGERRVRAEFDCLEREKLAEYAEFFRDAFLCYPYVSGDRVVSPEELFDD